MKINSRSRRENSSVLLSVKIISLLIKVRKTKEKNQRKTDQKNFLHGVFDHLSEGDMLHWVVIPKSK